MADSSEFLNWKLDIVNKLSNVPAVPCSGSEVLSATAQGKIATALAAMQTIPEPACVVPTPLLYSSKNDWSTDPFMVQIVDHVGGQGQWGEVIVGVERVETHEMVGFTAVPGMEKHFELIDDDRGGIQVWRWPMDTVQINGPVQFDIARTPGLSAAAICRRVDGNRNDFAVLTQETNYTNTGELADVAINGLTESILLCVQGQMDLDDLQNVWTVTAENKVQFQHPSDGLLDRVHLVLVEQDNVGQSGPFALDLTKNGAIGDRNWVAVMGSRS